MHELMFARISGTPRTGIVLQTRAKIDVINEQAPLPDEQNISDFNRALKKQLNWKLRKAPCGIYNCYGHIWANRRTSIYDNIEVIKFIEQDGYKKIDLKDLEVGDLVLYRRVNNLKHIDHIDHVGLVYKIEEAEGFTYRTPWVISKFRDFGGEVLHTASDFPHYDDTLIQYLTDRL